MDGNLKYRILCHHEVPDAKFQFLQGICDKACLDDHMVYSKKKRFSMVLTSGRHSYIRGDRGVVSEGLLNDQPIRENRP